MQQKTIGLIGGIGWASTAEYYRIINELSVKRTGLAHSARLVLFSMDQFDFTSRAARESPGAIEEFLVKQGHGLAAAGADFFAICANGAHRFAPAVTPRIGLPFVSIVEETARRVQKYQMKKVGLLGVKQTMAGSFYHEQLAQCGVEVLTPSAADQEIIHDIIYAELIHNRITEASRAIFVRIIGELGLAGAEGVILGCTEIPLLISKDDVALPVFDTTRIHCEAIVNLAFS